MAERSARFTAVIRHSGGPDLLALCVRHHLSIGADHIFVAPGAAGDALPDAMRDDPAIGWGDLTDSDSADAIPFLPDALRPVIEWSDADWLLFADSDELWLPESGRLEATRGLDETDAFVAERFDALVIEGAGGRLIPPDLGMPQRLPLIVGCEAASASRPEAPRAMLNRRALEALSVGEGLLRWRMPDDLLILHAPFTTERRFAMDVAHARILLEESAHRFGAEEAAQWRRRAAMDEAERSAEFRRQSFRASALPALQSQGLVASGAAAVYPLLQARTGRVSGDALGEQLQRMIGDRRRPAAAVPERAEPAEISGRWSPAPHREVASAEDCYFYHCMDIPGHGEVSGQWDLRGREAAYMGGVDLRGRKVLEIGTASGHLGFWMESQGAQVTAFDIDENQDWDIVPFFGFNQQAIIESRRAVMRRINNSWWFARNRLGSEVQVVYGSVYELDGLERMFDVVTVNSVLLHLRDPFLALSKAAARSRDTIIVTDVGEEYYLGVNAPFADRNCMHFVPTAANLGPLDTWWFLPEGLMREFLRILGFSKIEITRHKQRFMPDQEWPCYTAVGTR
jgi:SAM-dependent methyltransferase